MRVLFASANFGERVVGGAQLSVRLVAEQLVARGHDVGVVCVDPSEPRELRHQNGIRELRVSPGNLYWHRAERASAPRRLAWHAIDRFGFTLEKALGDALDEFRPDVVHTNVLSGLTVSAWTAADRRDIPIVHTIHDYYLLCINSGMRQRSFNCERPCLSCKVASLPSRRAAKMVDAVVYVSEHMKLAHEREDVFGDHALRAQVIGSFARKSSPSRLAHGGPLRLGFLGRLAKDKGLDRMIAELSALDPKSYVLRVGGLGAPEYEAELKRQARDASVEFLGRVEPDAFFDGIDVLVVPSTWHEPAARVVYEAGLSDVPVIVSKRGGLPELVGYGERGWVYEPDNAGELRALVRSIASAPEDARAKAARWAAIAHEFAPSYVADRTLDVYDAARSVRQARSRVSVAT